MPAQGKEVYFKSRDKLVVRVDLLSKLVENDNFLRIYYARISGVRIHDTWTKWYASHFPGNNIPGRAKEDSFVTEFVIEHNLSGMQALFERVTRGRSVNSDSFEKTFDQILTTNCPYTT